METRDLIENTTAKLKKKNMDMIVANNLKVPGAGFGVDTNVVTIITAQRRHRAAPQSKGCRRRSHRQTRLQESKKQTANGQSPFPKKIIPRPHLHIHL